MESREQLHLRDALCMGLKGEKARLYVEEALEWEQMDVALDLEAEMRAAELAEQIEGLSLELLKVERIKGRGAPDGLSKADVTVGLGNGMVDEPNALANEENFVSAVDCDHGSRMEVVKDVSALDFEMRLETSGSSSDFKLRDVNSEHSSETHPVTSDESELNYSEVGNAVGTVSEQYQDSHPFEVSIVSFGVPSLEIDDAMEDVQNIKGPYGKSAVNEGQNSAPSDTLGTPAESGILLCPVNEATLAYTPSRPSVEKFPEIDALGRLGKFAECNALGRLGKFAAFDAPGNPLRRMWCQHRYSGRSKPSPTERMIFLAHIYEDRGLGPPERKCLGYAWL